CARTFWLPSPLPACWWRARGTRHRTPPTRTAKALHALRSPHRRRGRHRPASGSCPVLQSRPRTSASCGSARSPPCARGDCTKTTRPPCRSCLHCV
ncbi:MAG: hypothetical protein AVDCRST_MAG71-1671, partial [uncultured Lysobacter sp.]